VSGAGAEQPAGEAQGVAEWVVSRFSCESNWIWVCVPSVELVADGVNPPLGDALMLHAAKARGSCRAVATCSVCGVMPRHALEPCCPNSISYPRSTELAAGLADSLGLDMADACAPILTNVGVLGGGNIAVCEEDVEQAIALLEEEGSIFGCVWVWMCVWGGAGVRG